MIITQTPLRISLFGGGTDFPDYFMEHGGAVLSTAIDKYIFVIIKKRFDDKIRIGYSKTELVDFIDEIEHDLIRESLRLTGITQGVEVATMADIPTRGSGLGSSSAVTVGALHAMYAHRNLLVDSNALADRAINIELNKLNSPIGWQDQCIVASGGLRYIVFSKTSSIGNYPLDLDNEIEKYLNQNLMLFYTGITRQASSILQEQKEKPNIKVLHQLKEMVYAAKSELQNGNVDSIGKMMHENWQLKKQLGSKVTNVYIDNMYETAIKAGALGGKISGAGGGGFLLLYCPLEKQESVRSALNLQELPFNIGADGTKVIFNYQR